MPEQSSPRQRYRSSCTNCATAKVKCNTARPECARCQERGLACLYAPSKRYGRRPASTGNKPYGLAAEVLPSPPVECSVNPCIYDLIFPDQDVNGPLRQVDDLCGPFVGGAPEEPVRHHLPLPPAVSSEWYLHNLGLGTPSVSHERETSIASQPPSAPASLHTHSLSSEPEDPLEISRNCLARAARILMEVRCDSNNAKLIGTVSYAREATACMADSSRNAELIMGDVIFTNRSILDQVTSILECHCVTGDYQTLVIICLIWFHLIDKYAGAVAAAAGPINRHSHNRLIGSVQVLLAELRHFSLLIDKLPVRGEEAQIGPRYAVIGPSISVLKQLQGDLARHLHNVSNRAEYILQQISI